MGTQSICRKFKQNNLRSRIQEARLDTPSAVMEEIKYMEARKKLKSRLSYDSEGGEDA